MASLYRRGKRWWVRLQWHGQEIRRSAGTTVKSEAREYLGALQAELRRRDRFGRERREFGEAVMAYMEHHLPSLRVSTIASYQQSLRVLVDEFGGRYLDEIKRGDIAAFEARQFRRVGASKVKHYRAALAGVFKRAVALEQIDANPCRDLDPIRLPDWQDRHITKADWTKLYAALPDKVRDVAAVSVTRGMRLGEILSLDWRDLDFDRDEIRIRRSKSGKPRVIPMEGASAHFPAQRQARGYVFATATGEKWREDDCSRRFKRAARRAGFNALRFHDLRHTFASWWVQDGGDLYVLQRILGHAGPAMTQRYAHLRVDDLRTKTGTDAG